VLYKHALSLSTPLGEQLMMGADSSGFYFYGLQTSSSQPLFRLIIEQTKAIYVHKGGVAPTQPPYNTIQYHLAYTETF
jgi:hypothetical protein